MTKTKFELPAEGGRYIRDHDGRLIRHDEAIFVPDADVAPNDTARGDASAPAPKPNKKGAK